MNEFFQGKPAGRKASAVSIVGRHNSGKTTLIEKLIAELRTRGLDVGNVKYCGHAGFDIDHPGRDSYRYREAGATEVVVVSENRMACVRELTAPLECAQVVQGMDDHDIILVEGFRQGGLDCIEVMRMANERDRQAIEEYLETGMVRGRSPVAVVTDSVPAVLAAEKRGTPAFGFDDIGFLCDWLQVRYAREKSPRSAYLR